MDLACGVVIGAICFNPPIGETSIHFDNEGFGAAAEVDASGWHAGILLGTDVITSLDPAKLDRSCVEGLCVSYWRKCEGAAYPLTCYYVVGSGIRVNVTFETEMIARTMMDRIGVKTDPQNPRAHFRLSDLKNETRYRLPDDPFSP